MSKIIISSSKKKCAFCRYWNGPGGTVTRSKNRGYWDVESGVIGNCEVYPGERKQSNGGDSCSRFVKDDYKYPDIYKYLPYQKGTAFFMQNN